MKKLKLNIKVRDLEPSKNVTGGSGGEDGVRLSVPVETSKPSIGKHSYEK
jgi:hypothetical protein